MGLCDPGNVLRQRFSQIGEIVTNSTRPVLVLFLLTLAFVLDLALEALALC
jgi:hypothetical protein